MGSLPQRQVHRRLCLGRPKSRIASTMSGPEREAERLEHRLRARLAERRQLVAAPAQLERDRHRRKQRARLRARDPEDARHRRSGMKRGGARDRAALEQMQRSAGVGPLEVARATEDALAVLAEPRELRELPVRQAERSGTFLLDR